MEIRSAAPRDTAHGREFGGRHHAGQLSPGELLVLPDGGHLGAASSPLQPEVLGPANAAQAEWVVPVFPTLRPVVQREGRARASARRPRWVKDGLCAAVVAILFYTLSFNVSVVRGSSMSPGIHDGDRILIEPWSYVFAGVSRGDVVVMRSPVDPSVDYIKRVIGLPGDEILVAAGAVWVNGELLREPYAVQEDRELFQWTRVIDEHYFVLGDNRPHSSDSREFGLVPASFLRGRVDLRVWPLPRMGWLE